MAARRFLYIFAGLITLAVLLAVAYKAFEGPIWRMALIPGTSFDADSRDPMPDYAQATSWAARPDLAGNPSMQAPDGYLAAPKPAVDIFYVAPTTYISRDHWNAPKSDTESRKLTGVMLRTQASAFNAVGAVWAPYYRQATFGAFMTDKPDGRQALDLAYHDVLAAFDAFQAQRDPKRAFILVGHSQGARHLMQLLKERIAGRPAKRQLVAAYVIGWPVSMEADLAPLGLDACQTPSATGCVISWQTFGPEADLTKTAQAFAAVPTLSGSPRAGTTQLCVNPINFWANGQIISKDLNLGALPFSASAAPMAALKPHLVGARCDAKGFLILSQNLEDPFEERKMPGDNYHVYDMNLFWANIRANAEIRVENFLIPR